MTREQEYRQLANSAFSQAAEEESAQLMAQWKILGARYLELADNRRRSMRTKLSMIRFRGIACGVIERDINVVSTHADSHQKAPTCNAQRSPGGQCKDKLCRVELQPVVPSALSENEFK